MVAWPVGVNTDAYGMEMTPKENVERIEFDSGKARTYLKNTAQKNIFSFMLYLNDEGESSEYKTFVAWWNNTLKSGALPFSFPNLMTHSGTAEYRATTSYNASGQKNKEVSITVEEM